MTQEIFTHDNQLHLEGIDDSERTEVECFCRVMGYLRPINCGEQPLWNIGKVQEFRDRVYFNTKKTIERCQAMGQAAE